VTGKAAKSTFLSVWDTDLRITYDYESTKLSKMHNVDPVDCGFLMIYYSSLSSRFEILIIGQT
jgi:hypothetical protein